jgi:hypothetical protein
LYEAFDKTERVVGGLTAPTGAGGGVGQAGGPGFRWQILHLHAAMAGVFLKFLSEVSEGKAGAGDVLAPTLADEGCGRGYEFDGRADGVVYVQDGVSLGGGVDGGRGCAWLVHRFIHGRSRGRGKLRGGDLGIFYWNEAYYPKKIIILVGERSERPTRVDEKKSDATHPTTLNLPYPTYVRPPRGLFFWVSF